MAWRTEGGDTLSGLMRGRDRYQPEAWRTEGGDTLSGLMAWRTEGGDTLSGLMAWRTEVERPTGLRVEGVRYQA
ncbi:hypothetical protein NHX12_027526 [Muraenolepis orangiensis]|uniref:Uncharacterized protein n=1 Tax=Muraenolepis orangiensis TaxID=630683 RepID=A0A9Q0EHC2_9TELE|nr:hypothetical protein NHX12_027526 [Muraenolepis orangiensis]